MELISHYRFGRNVYALGEKRGDPWRIGIQILLVLQNYRHNKCKINP